MKRSSILVDASGLIYLAKADALGLAHRCFGRLVVTPSVWRETVEAGERRGASEIGRIRRASEAGHVSRLPLAPGVSRRANELARRYQLGAGESEVLASARRGVEVLVDEGRATRVAEWLGLVPVSTLFIPVLGTLRGRLDAPAARDLLHELAVVTGARADVVLRLELILGRHSR